MSGIVTWLVVLTMIFVFIFLYQMGSVMVANIDKEIRNITEVSNSTEAVGTLDINTTIWRYWPIFLIFGLLLWAFYASTKKEPVWRGY